MTVTNWTDEQLTAVTSAMLKTLHEHPKTSIGGALYDAQVTYIPYAERLARVSCSVYTLHHPRLRAAIIAAGMVYPSRETKTKGGIAEDLRKTAKIDTIRDLLPAPKPKTVERTYTVAEVTDMMRKFEERLMARVSEAVSLQVRRDVSRLLGEPEVIEAETAVVPTLAAPPAPTLRILVTGFEQCHNEEVLRKARAAYPELEAAEFRFWKNDGNRRLNASADWATHIVVMTRWMPHDLPKKLHDHPGMHRVNGSVASALAQIGEIVKQSSSV